MPAQRSEVWKYFRKLPDNPKRAECKLCLKQYSACGNTTNFWTHLRDAHYILPSSKGSSSNNAEDVETDQDQGDAQAQPPRSPSPVQSPPCDPVSSKKQPTLDSCWKRGISLKEGGSMDAMLKDGLLYWVCKDRLPLSTPEKPGFRHFVEIALSGWKPPSRQTLTRAMESKHDRVKAYIQNCIQKMSSVTLTADGWTHQYTTTSYLGVTLHYLNGTTMESIVLGLIPLEEAHTAAYLEQKMKDVCTDWTIDPDKVAMMITDNAANITLAAKNAFGASKHRPCFDHTLNLVAKNAISTRKVNGQDVENVPDLTQLIEKFKDVVTFSHKSTNFSNMLKQLQINQGKTEGTALRLIQDVKTRWNSTFLMLKRFLEMSALVSQVAVNFSEVVMPTGAELATAKLVCQLLKPFYLATVQMAAEKVSTASRVIPIVFNIRKKLSEKVVPATDKIATALKSFLVKDLNHRFSACEMDSSLAIATILDPRFKRSSFNQPLAVSRALTLISNEVKEILRKEGIDVVAEVQEQERQREQAVCDSDDDDDLWSNHDSMVSQSSLSAADDFPGGHPVQLRMYMSKPLSPRLSNPLVEWEAMKSVYPQLYQVARKYLPIVATSVPSERLFSEAGLIMTDIRNRLSKGHSSQLVVLSTVDDRVWFAVK